MIFADQCTEAGGHCYHVDHYLCAECQCPLAGHQYVTLAGRPYCTTCYHSVYADYCCACGRIIAVEQRHVVHADRKWHDICFRCAACDRQLVGHACLLVADGRVFCNSPDCTNQRRRKLLPVDNSWYSCLADTDDVIRCEEEPTNAEHQQQQQRLSADMMQLVSRQTTV